MPSACGVMTENYCEAANRRHFRRLMPSGHKSSIDLSFALLFWRLMMAIKQGLEKHFVVKLTSTAAEGIRDTKTNLILLSGVKSVVLCCFWVVSCSHGQFWLALSLHKQFTAVIRRRDDATGFNFMLSLRTRKKVFWERRQGKLRGSKVQKNFALGKTFPSARQTISGHLGCQRDLLI